MLRRMKIGGRLNLLIMVPLLALIASAAVGYLALQRSSVRGDEYKALKMAQDLKADTAPPPANLLEAWANVNQVAVIASADGWTADSHAEIDEHMAVIEAARARRRLDGRLARGDRRAHGSDRGCPCPSTAGRQTRTRRSTSTWQ